MKHSCSNAIFSIAVLVLCISAGSSCSSGEDGAGLAGRGGRASRGGTAGASGAGGSTAGSGGSASGAGGTQDGGAGVTGSGGALGNGGSGGSAGSGGNSGSAGSGGTNGTSGTAGRGGSSGTAGTGGSAGAAGTGGTSGTAGTGGTSGASGSAGTAGRGGTNGASGTAGTNGASGTGGGPGCAAGQSDCGGVCVNTTNDAAHCGRCNNPCPSGICANSACTPVTTGVIGWASVNGRGLATTSGGQGGSTVDVNSASALQSAAESSARQIIRISGNLSVSELNVNSTKTLIGVGTNTTINGGININGKSNVIIQNLRVNGKSSGAGGDAIHIENSHHIWIDHCDVWDAPDGNLDISNQSDLITVSWTRFWYSTSPGDSAHRFCNLIGSDDAAPDAGYLNVTFHHNWWAERVAERMPRVRFGKVHVFNNYFSSSGNNYCVRAGVEADVRIENNHFENVQNPYEIDSDNGTAVVTAAGNTFSGGGGSRDTRGTAFTPPYQFQLQPASGIRDAVRAGWGPR